MNASEEIDKVISETSGWKGELLGRLRRLIHEVDPEISEEWKWNTPVFADKGNVCAIAAFSDHVKINFFKGPKLKDEHRLFNSGLEAKFTRAIDFFEDDELKESELKDLIKEAVEFNINGGK